MLKQVLSSHRILLVGGPGGVGKTTLAAALGLRSAELGYKTLVLTVDPARRLAQALGFTNFEKDLQRVPIAQGELHASMLDSEHYFDKIIERFARDEIQRNKILKHPIYQTMVKSLGGTHEYAAMERLLEYAKETRFEKIIVDTPPTQNSVELLSAPARLADFMDNSVLRWFQGSSPAYFQFFRKGTQIAMKLLKTIFGAEFLDSFSGLINDLDGMQAGFRSRHLEVIDLLKSPETAFLLVTRASEARFLESQEFIQTLKDYPIALRALLLNRLLPECPASYPSQPSIDALVHYLHSLFQQETFWAGQFETLISKDKTLKIPKLDSPPSDLGELSQLGKFLIS